MRDESISDRVWGTLGNNGNNNWNRPAALNTSLNSTYYNNLTSVAQSQIVESSYYTGAVTNNNMQDQISDEKSSVSNVKITLPTLSEYIKAGSNTSCKTFYVWSINFNYNTCRNSNWMYISDYWWTLTSSSNSSTYMYYVGYGGEISEGFARITTNAPLPTTTPSSKVKITGGNGSQSNPYIIE